MNFNIINNLRNKGLTAVALVGITALLGSCSLIYNDLPECATRPATHATVNFIYDYNTAETDGFADFIGAVTLYAFDSDGHLVLVKEHTVDLDAINAEGYSMPIELPVGKYTLYASARENTAGYEASLQNPGAKFRRSGDTQGNPLTALFYTLDHQDGVVDHQQLSLEHFWLTRQAVSFEMTEAPMPEEGAPQPADVWISTTVPLQRVTNNLHLTITRELATRAGEEALSADDYDVRVTTVGASDRLDLLGRPLEGGTALTYTPHSIASGTTDAGRPCLRAELSTSRIMHEQDASKHMQLSITSKKTGETTTWDLPSLLAKGREADAYALKGWSEQEYLDRESDYTLAVEFRQNDSGWRYIEISIAQLNWAKRIQNVDL